LQEEAAKWRQRCNELQTKYGSIDLTEHKRVVAECQRISTALQVTVGQTTLSARFTKACSKDPLSQT
jgi:hypothetical protein